MHNPPHPGLVLREYLGNVPVTKAASHLRITRVTLSRVLNGKAGFGIHGNSPRRRFRYDSGVVDDAIAVRLVEGAEGETAGRPQIGKCCQRCWTKPGN